MLRSANPRVIPSGIEPFQHYKRFCALFVLFVFMFFEGSLNNVVILSRQYQKQISKYRNVIVWACVAGTFVVIRVKNEWKLLLNLKIIGGTRKQWQDFIPVDKTKHFNISRSILTPGTEGLFSLSFFPKRQEALNGQKMWRIRYWTEYRWSEHF